MLSKFAVMRWAARPGLAFVLSLSVSSPVRAAEVVVQVDSLAAGQQGAIQVGFAAGESAAVWLNSPCDGSIVAVQVFWRSLFGGEPQTAEDSITIFNGGTFPFPGGPLELLEAPLLTDGVLNEYRYLDKQQTIPIDVPVARDQVFVVSFKFFNDPGVFGPSIVTDTNGCQSGKNAIDAIGPGWINACSAGVSGDFVIRAVVDCAEVQGACCLPNGTCQFITQTQCTNQNGVYRGDNTSCLTPGICNGACCFGDGSCSQLSAGQCASNGGSFKGATVPCSPNLCTGACCLPNGTCAETQTSNQCAAAGGVYKGDGATCAGSTCTGACCYNNGSCQLQTLAQCGGVWHGPASNCGSVTCPARGSCCLADGSCLDNQLASECAAAGGFYKGDSTTCAANPCVGACCFAGSCLNLTKTDCNQIGGSVWQGPAFPCAGGNTCPTGACCLPLGECLTGTTPASCASQSGVYHNAQSCALANCPIPTGACCFNNGGSCINELQPSQCGLIAGSVWKGENTVCALACCPPPKGDVNGDGLLNGVDIQRFVAALLGTPTNLEICKGDFNGSATVDVGDIPGMVGAVLAVP